MKVALFTDSFTQTNGVSTHVKNLAGFLSKKHEVTVYTGRTGRTGGAKSEHAERGKASGTKDKNYLVKGLPCFPFLFERTYDVVMPIPKRIDADVVHIHSVFGAGMTGLLSAKMQKIPTVITTHTIPAHFFSMYHADFLEHAGWSFLMSFYNKCDHVIAQTNATAQEYKDHGLAKPTSIVSAGVDAKFFSKANAKQFEKKYGLRDFVLSTVRLSPEKRPELLLEACKRLEIPIVLTSDGPLRAQLEKKFPEARFLGRIPIEDLRDAYAAARVFAIPSEKETEGLAVLEAMAAGTPVVASRIPCLAELIKDGKNGFLFDSKASLEKKLGLAWNDAGLRRRLSKNAKSAAWERDMEKCAEKIVRVYKALL